MQINPFKNIHQLPFNKIDLQFLIDDYSQYPD